MTAKMQEPDLDVYFVIGASSFVILGKPKPRDEVAIVLLKDSFGRRNAFNARIQLRRGV